MVKTIDLEVVEELVRAFGRARDKCPGITGVCVGGEGFDPIIRVDYEGDEPGKVELKFPDNMELPE